MNNIFHIGLRGICQYSMGRMACNVDSSVSYPVLDYSAESIYSGCRRRSSPFPGSTQHVQLSRPPTRCSAAYGEPVSFTGWTRLRLVAGVSRLGSAEVVFASLSGLSAPSWWTAAGDSGRTLSSDAWFFGPWYQGAASRSVAVDSGRLLVEAWGWFDSQWRLIQVAHCERLGGRIVSGG